MFPDDRVLVGVINRKKDAHILRENHWYRIPQTQMPHGVYMEYLAFYFSVPAAKPLPSGILCYAPVRGVELAYRRDLLPDETKRADEVYYKVQLGDIVDLHKPIANPTKRRIHFIYSTWDRFISAQVIADLYRESDYFVDRIYHALREHHYQPQRYWVTQARRGSSYGEHVRILCERGAVVASPYAGPDVTVLMDAQTREDDLLAQVLAQIAAQGGPVSIRIPVN